MSVPLDRTCRSLRGLEKTAATSRVLNLGAIGARHADSPEHRANPFFKARALNSAVIIKHRLRPDERRDFAGHGGTATKLLLPFERTDLALGGRSLFVGEDYWMQSLAALRGCEDDLARDAGILKALDELPSLDPFLLQQHLKRRGYVISPTYFELSDTDVALMQQYVADELAPLVQLASDGGRPSSNSAGRLVRAILGTDDDDTLKPLLAALRLQGREGREGLFSWKGILYYKWTLELLLAQMREIWPRFGQLKLSGRVDVDLAAQVNTTKTKVVSSVEHHMRNARRYTAAYDEVFRQLTTRGETAAFREFLLSAPKTFIVLGESCGLMSHIASFWRYRFPPEAAFRVPAAELLEILQDFECNLSLYAGQDKVLSA
ncbi:MAG TPA: hypothetical protein VFN88_07630 [Caulobacteraceae bacterium]|nr:hypothetical protein [Caulobacteraceae bacterium]